MEFLQFIAKEWQFTFMVGWWIYWMCDMFLDARGCQGCGHCKHCEHQACLDEYEEYDEEDEEAECEEHEFCCDDIEAHEEWVNSTEFVVSCDGVAVCGNDPDHDYTLEWCDWCETLHVCPCVPSENVKEDERPKHPQVAPTPTLPAPTNPFGAQKFDR
jgi:hypothetical protein